MIYDLRYRKEALMNRIRKGIACMICSIMLTAVFCATANAALPTYTVSSKYKESQFYDNLLSVPLSGDQATDALAIALSQLGYHEGDSNDDFDGLNTSGTRNFVEYNRLYGRLDNGEGNGISYGYYWCASFVNWCLQQAGLTKAQTAAREVSCHRWIVALEDAGMYEKAHKSYIPKSGDMIFFYDPENDSDNWKKATHVGLVRYVEGDLVYTVEGNTSNDSKFSQNGNYVCLKSYSLDDSLIVGYGLVDYETNAVIPDVDHSGKTRSTGLYISENDICVYTDASEDSETLGTIDRFSAFEVCHIKDDWVNINFTSDNASLDGWARLSDKVHQMTSTATSITVTYVADGATNVPKEQSYSVGEDVILSSKVPQMRDARFIGWALTEGSASIDYEPDERISIDKSITLYAVWDSNMLTVTFKDSFGSIISEVKGFSGDKLTPPVVGDKEGYIFEGWDGDIPIKMTESITYTAIYSKIPDPTVEDTTAANEQATEKQTEQQTEQTSEPATKQETEETLTESESDRGNSEKPIANSPFGCNATSLTGALATVIPILGAVAIKKKMK